MNNECSWYDPSCALAWLSAELKAFALWIYDAFMSGFSALVEAIPVPDFLANVGSYTLPSSLSWAAHALNLDIGLGIVVTAYTARFILRRIPFIG
jgi:hypothetical protein